MRIVLPSYEILTPIRGEDLQQIERIARTCYKSEDRITGDSAVKFVTMLRDRGHEAMLEFGTLAVRFICDRGVSHELVRHRLCSFAQESTRYVDYQRGHVEFILPPWVQSVPAGEYAITWHGVYGDPMCEPEEMINGDAPWFWHCAVSERDYHVLRSHEWQPQQARAVLPNSVKTEIVIQANYREWRHIMQLRTSRAAHPQMRELMVPLLAELQSKIPVLFDDLQAGAR